MLLVALVAPAPAAIAGFARAARDVDAPLILARPAGAAEEKGPEEARDDAAFVEAAFRIAAELHFSGPLVLLKEPPRAGSAVSETERVRREIETGFTGVALTAEDTATSARNAALAAANVCNMELGLEVVPLGGAQAGAELARQLRSRGARPSALRVTGVEDEAPSLAEELEGTALASASEDLVADLLAYRIQQLVASGPFLRALRRAAPGDVWATLEAWADEKAATVEDAAARHQRLLRDLPPLASEKLEAHCFFEALEVYQRAGARKTAARLVEALAALHPPEP